MSKRIPPPAVNVTEEIERQIKKDIEDRENDVTIPAGKRARKTQQNDAGTSLPPYIKEK